MATVLCSSCGDEVRAPADRCPRCGSTELASVERFETLVLPELPPDERWMAQPFRIRVSWSSSPPLTVLRALARSGPFGSSSRALLEQVRATPTLTSEPMSHGRAKELLNELQEALDGATVALQPAGARDGT